MGGPIVVAQIFRSRKGLSADDATKLAALAEGGDFGVDGGTMIVRDMRGKLRLVEGLPANGALRRHGHETGGPYLMGTARIGNGGRGVTGTWRSIGLQAAHPSQRSGRRSGTAGSHRRRSVAAPGERLSTALDTGLTAGFRFQCRPGCGLCCFTSPVVTAREQASLLALDPNVRFGDGGDGGPVIASRPGGGACQFLEGTQCRCRPVRPYPCREFPLAVSLLYRPQVSVILSCPGVGLDELSRWAGPQPPVVEAEGLQEELEAVRGRLGSALGTARLREGFRRYRSARRALEGRRRWLPPSDLRAEVRRRLDLPRSLASFSEDLPPPESSPEEWPFFFDPSRGIVAWKPSKRGLECFRLRESRGGLGSAEVVPYPSDVPPLTEDARRLLCGYLAYFLERDLFLGIVLDRCMRERGSQPIGVARSELRRIATQVLARGVLRRALSSSCRGPLDGKEIGDGIRATDLDLLDRPGVGLRL
jgi:Fe-S-cluster containining protein